MEEIWFVEADCDEVNIQSEMFQTEKTDDFVTISDREKSQRYSGKQLVYQNASSSFSIKFQPATDIYSDIYATDMYSPSEYSSYEYVSSGFSSISRYGFILNWTCIKPKQTLLIPKYPI